MAENDTNYPTRVTGPSLDREPAEERLCVAEPRLHLDPHHEPGTHVRADRVPRPLVA